MGVTAGSSYGDPMGFQFVVGGSMLKFSADADGAGGLVATPTLTIDGVEVGADYSALTSTYLPKYNGTGLVDSIFSDDGTDGDVSGELTVHTSGLIRTVSGYARYEGTGNVALRSGATSAPIAGNQATNNAFFWDASGDFTLYRAGSALFNSNATGVNIPTTKNYQIAGDVVLAYAETTLDTSDLSTISSTPIVLVSNPGANKAIQVISASCYYNHITGDYSGGSLIIGVYNNRNQVYFPQTMVEASSDSFAQGVWNQTYTKDTLTANDNLEIYGNSNITGGGGTFFIQVLYRVVDVS